MNDKLNALTVEDAEKMQSPDSYQTQRKLTMNERNALTAEDAEKAQRPDSYRTQRKLTRNKKR